MSTRQKSGILLICAGLILASSSGCTTYMANRVDDLADTGKMSMGLGIGAGVDFQATDFLHPSMGLGGVALSFGHENRYVSGFFGDSLRTLPCISPTPFEYASRWMPGRGRDGRFEKAGISSVYTCRGRAYEEISSYMVWKDYYRDDSLQTDIPWARRMGIEVTVMAVFLKVRTGVNPAELFDFLIGFTTVDIAGDDKIEEGTEKKAGGKTGN